MKKINISKTKIQLTKIVEENNLSNFPINLIQNNIEIYNNLIENIDISNTKNVYIVTNLSTTIFNQLKHYNIFPEKKHTKNDESDSFIQLVNKIQNNN
ncbi:MAG: hypothetical protein JZU47_08135 [Prolixibacteraceae bacterium]|nr:hypothetical protein [Prolixibacteraceae bacterium]